MSESLCLYVSCAFPWALFRLLVLFYSDVSFHYILLVIFSYYPLKAFVLSNERQEGSESRWEGKWG